MEVYDPTINYFLLYQLIYTKLNPYHEICSKIVNPMELVPRKLDLKMTYLDIETQYTIFSKGNFFYIDDPENNCLYQIDAKGNVKKHIHSWGYHSNYQLSITRTDYRDPLIAYLNSSGNTLILDVSNFDDIKYRTIPFRSGYRLYIAYNNGAIYHNKKRHVSIAEFDGYKPFSMHFNNNYLSSNRQYIYNCCGTSVIVYSLDGQIINPVYFRLKAFRLTKYLDEDYFLAPSMVVYKYIPNKGFVKCINLTSYKLDWSCTPFVRNDMLFYVSSRQYYILDLWSRVTKMFSSDQKRIMPISNATGTALYNKDSELFYPC